MHLGDEINLIEEGLWYGHPNFARYRLNPTEHFYEEKWLSQEVTTPETYYRPPITTHESAVEGLAYYRADTFGTGARGNLYVAYYKKSAPTGLLEIKMSQDGTEMLSQHVIEEPEGDG